MKQMSCNTDLIVREPYVCPALVVYGTVQDLTNSGGSTSGEGGTSCGVSGFPAPNKRC